MDVPLEKREIEIIKKWIKKNHLEKKEFIEVGCGDGLNLEEFSKLGMKGIGIDISKYALDIVENKKLRNIEIKKTDFLKYNNNKNNPGMIFMLNFLEHVKNPGDFIKKAYNVLKKDKHLIISLPVNPKSYGFADKNAGHVQRFN